MVEIFKNAIGNSRGLGLGIRSEGYLLFYKFEIGFDGKIEGTICASYKEKYVKIKDDYDKTYDNVVEVLVESYMLRENDDLDESIILEILKGKSFHDLKEKSRYNGYTEFVMTNKEFGLFIY